jgi:hypothetical protein
VIRGVTGPRDGDPNDGVIRTNLGQFRFIEVSFHMSYLVVTSRSIQPVSQAILGRGAIYFVPSIGLKGLSQR